MTEIEDCFEQCRSLLAEQRATLIKTRDEALTTAERAKQLLDQLELAFTGLSSNPKSKRPKEAKQEGKRPCSNRGEVLALVHTELAAGPLDAAKLKARVTQRLRDEGRNLSMFAKLFESCLADPSLSGGEQGVYSLRQASRWKTKAPVEGGLA